MLNLDTILSSMINIQDKTITKLINLSGILSGEYYNKDEVEQYISNSIVKIPVGACSSLGTYLNNDYAYFSWTDPNDVEINGAILVEFEQTILIRKENSYPSSYLDGEIIASTNSSNKNYYKDHAFIDNTREQNKTYYYKLFSKSTNNIWNNLEANKFSASTNLSWDLVQQFVIDGQGPELFPVGTTFIVDHSEYTTSNGIQGIAFTVLGHDQVPAADESIQHTMCLGMSEILFSNSQFDAPELEYALTEDTIAITGKTYYTYDGNNYTQLIEGTDYNIDDSIPNNTYYEKNLNGRAEYGNNNFSQSNLLQWANSAGAANSWFVKQNIWDTCGTNLNNKNGFLKYIDSSFLGIVKEAKITTAKCNAEGGGSYTINAKFWLLSVTQVSGRQINGITENEQLTYYVNNSVNKNGNWWLRSPYSSTVHSVGVVKYSTNSQVSKVNASSGVSLACIIG